MCFYILMCLLEFCEIMSVALTFSVEQHCFAVPETLSVGDVFFSFKCRGKTLLSLV